MIIFNNLSPFSLFSHSCSLNEFQENFMMFVIAIPAHGFLTIRFLNSFFLSLSLLCSFIADFIHSVSTSPNSITFAPWHLNELLSGQQFCILPCHSLFTGNIPSFFWVFAATQSHAVYYLSSYAKALKNMRFFYGIPLIYPSPLFDILLT